VVCPWCAVESVVSSPALERFEHADEIEVVWRAFELDPNAPARREGDRVERLAKKYGMTRQQAAEANDRLTATAAAEGLDFHFERAQAGNTFDAHRLLHYARSASPGMQDALKERLLVAYFSEGAAIGEPDTLVRLATEVGSTPSECADVLGRRPLRGRGPGRRARGPRARDHRCVPFFVVDGKFGIPGAQDADTILDLLERAWTKAHPLEVIGPSRATNDDGVCEGDKLRRV